MNNKIINQVEKIRFCNLKFFVGCDFNFTKLRHLSSFFLKKKEK